MDCHGSQIMRCPKCYDMFCVPAIVGKASVWHSGCEVELEPLLLGERCEVVQRADVYMNRQRDRLEVSTRAERE